MRSAAEAQPPDDDANVFGDVPVHARDFVVAGSAHP